MCTHSKWLLCDVCKLGARESSRDIERERERQILYQRIVCSLFALNMKRKPRKCKKKIIIKRAKDTFFLCSHSVNDSSLLDSVQ